LSTLSAGQVRKGGAQHPSHGVWLPRCMPLCRPSLRAFGVQYQPAHSAAWHACVHWFPKTRLARACTQTVVDIWGQSPLPPNASVALKADVARVWELLLEAVAAADKVSPLNAAPA
jgi:hypothetical protein